MAPRRKSDPETEALIQRAVEELRVVNPALFEEPRPYTDEEHAQIVADADEIERIWRAMARQGGDDIMALDKKAHTEFADLLRQAVEEQRAVNPQLFEKPQHLSEAVIEQLLRDEAELEQTWDEMDRTRGNAPRRMTGAEAVDLDRGE